jgi:glycosyltransferase involved in cell wall biosynthesis
MDFTDPTPVDPADRLVLPSPKRIDLHVHTVASSVAGEAALRAIACPECYSSVDDVYAQATRRGMDFVAVTDHDTIAGATKLAAARDNVIVGEELTCWFPEDRCKIHLLLYGIDAGTHAAVQSLADDIYAVAEYVERHRVAHSVAHPLYRQNDRLERWHLERLILLFKGFEVLNGAHSALHRESIEPVLAGLDRYAIDRLADAHRIVPRWPEPWYKAKTGGSDDHGLLNVGRTWTEFPPETHTVADVLQCLREGTCRPGGEAGSSLKLAHAFYAVGVRYAARGASLEKKPRTAATSPAAQLLQAIVGERAAPTKGQLVRAAVAGKLRAAAARLNPFRPKHHPKAGVAMLGELFGASVLKRVGDHPALLDAIKAGLPPLGEHEELFKLLNEVNADLAGGIVDDVIAKAGVRDPLGLFDTLAAVAAQQFMLWPYYFALFHQNKERAHLRRITGVNGLKANRHNLKVGLFTDTFDDINGVARFVRDMCEQARLAGRDFTAVTCSHETRYDLPNRVNFEPMLSRPMPFYPELRLNLPPVLQILEWADRQQFDAIHVSTPGAMGTIGWIVAKMLRVPVLMTYHTDFPAYIENLSGDHRMASATTLFMKLFYRQAAAVFSRSESYQSKLTALGVDESKLPTILPGINTDKFNATHRDEGHFAKLGVTEPLRLLYCGRVSVEKNLPLLAEAFKKLCGTRRDAALVIAGDGPYLERMRDELRGLPAYFLGFQNDGQLGPLYASADLFVFPSRTDTLGQVVMEAQASGLPAIVCDEGGPKETVDDGVTGLVIGGCDADAWVAAIDTLLNDAPRRQMFGRNAERRSARYSLAKTFEHFWSEHAKAVEGVDPEGEPAPVRVVSPVPTAV